MTFRIYDIATDSLRDITQKDWDDVQVFLNTLGRLQEKLKEADKRKDMDFRLATFVNPMRTDGLFVAEDIPIEPYPGVSRFDGKPIYPACPKTKFSLGHQVEPDFARELVRRWNVCGERGL